MSTLAEIRAALPKLTKAELDELARDVLAARQNVAPNRHRVVTRADAAKWWQQIEHMSEEDAEAFARDWEEARRIMNRPPKLQEWE